MHIRISKLLLAFTFLIFVNEANALRCGSKIVDITDRKHKVLKKCGEPDYVDAYDQVSIFHPYHLERIEIWTYNFGRNKFMQELIFRNGRLHRINALDYGY